MARNNNPIPEILDLIPYQGTVLSLLLAEEMRTVIHKCTKTIVSNGYVLMLLGHLRDNNLIEIEDLTWPSVAGNIFIIKRKINGTQLQE